MFLILISSLRNVSLDHAQEAVASFDRQARVKAAAVEVCQCPTGYSGLSCESCASGYQKSKLSFLMNQCEKQSNFFF